MNQLTIMLIAGLFTLSVAYGMFWSKCRRERKEKR